MSDLTALVVCVISFGPPKYCKPGTWETRSMPWLLVGLLAVFRGSTRGAPYGNTFVQVSNFKLFQVSLSL